MDIDVVDLKLVVNITDTGSVSVGGQFTFLSPPAASNRLKRVEEALGVKLLYRGHQSVTPTAAGVCFVARARRVLLELEQLRSEVQAQARGTREHVRMAANTSFVTDFMPDVLQRFLLAHPDASIDLEPRMADEVARGLHDGSTDIGLISAIQPRNDLASIDLGPDPLVAAVASYHTYAGRPSVGMMELLAQSHVSLSSGSTIAAYVQQQFERIGQQPQLRVSVPDYRVMCQMAAAGLGLGILHRSIASRHDPQGKLALLRIDEDWADHHRYILLRELDALTGYARELVTAIMDEAHRLQKAAGRREHLLDSRRAAQVHDSR